MRTEKEIRDLKAKLNKLSGYIVDVGKFDPTALKDLIFINDLSDAFSWVLEEILDKHFSTAGFIDLDGLERIAQGIEKRTGIPFASYKI